MNPSSNPSRQSTIDWYSENADAFSRSADSAEMSELYSRFLPYLPEGAHILDAGCGNGRDSLFFKEKGYQVTAFDLSPEMARRASVLIAQDAVVRDFSDVKELQHYEGIWACASLLHVPYAELGQILSQLAHALKENGVLYLSFKKGDGERLKDGRQFTDATKTRIQTIVSEIPILLPLEFWETEDTRPDRAGEVWINALIKRIGERRLCTGGAKPLLPQLCKSIAHAQKIDLAVAFVKVTGLRLLLPDLIASVTNRSAQLRFLCSDYLGLTDPEALRHLMLLKEMGSDVRLFITRPDQSFHLKAYLFTVDPNSQGARTCAYIGSSNISAMALKDGIEWNVRIDHPTETAFLEAQQEFDLLFQDSEARELTHELIDDYETRRRPPSSQISPGSDEKEPPPQPNRIQEEALKALDQTRTQGYRRGLVVLATGLGKTWLAAFDARQMGAKTILFVAHREEILRQAASTFLRIQPHARAGYYMGAQRDEAANLLFASVQTLGREENLSKFEPTHFDYVVIDEFHHASAHTYRRLLRHFTPRFLLGLTATPDRTDQADILALCDDNLVHDTNLLIGIEQGFLVPFHYFGIYDERVNYTEIPWRNGKFDPTALSARVSTQERADHALRIWNLRGRDRTLAFCVSMSHAEFMSRHFKSAGVACAAVHSESDMSRGEALELLSKGELKVIFSVDLFNEGVDLPSIDTIMMLRPTESKILFLQQLGRGLRKSPSKESLVVLDFIGNHRAFLNRPQALLGISGGYQAIARFAEDVQAEALDLPPGCMINYDLALIDFMRQLSTTRQDSLYLDLKEQLSRRPTLCEFARAGGSPAEIRKQSKSWFHFLSRQGDLSEHEKRVETEHEDFLTSIETERMSKCFKMILLEAFGELGGWHGPVKLPDLTEHSWKIISRRPKLFNEVAEKARASESGTSKVWSDYWLENPVNAWIGESRKDPDAAWFQLEDSVFQARFDVAIGNAEILESMVLEIISFRLGRFEAAVNESSVTSSSEPLSPRARQSKLKVGIGDTVYRKDIPALFDESFVAATWNSGHVVIRPKGVHVLMVNLDQSGVVGGSGRINRWLDSDTFCWISQNSTDENGKRGKEIIQHRLQGFSIHLFIRNAKTLGGKAAPFTYLGEVEYQGHVGTRPMTVTFRLV